MSRPPITQFRRGTLRRRAALARRAAPARARSAPRHPQEPPAATGRGAASPAHWSMQVEPPAHDSEHEPVQRSVHVEPLSQLMLPLGPAVMSHCESPLQLTLHDSPHVPEQSFWSLQPSVQLDPLHPESPISHVSPAVHEHDDPVHSGGDEPPQAPRKHDSDTSNRSPSCMDANVPSRAGSPDERFLRKWQSPRSVMPRHRRHTDRAHRASAARASIANRLA